MNNFQIIDQTDDYLIIVKPAGILTHPAAGAREPALTDFLLARWPELKKVGDDPARPGIVHRLDREASGLLVVAKTNAFFEHIKEQFQKRTVEKSYTALAHGRVSRDEGEINFPINRSSRGGKMAALPLTKKGEVNPDGRTAISKFQVEQRFVNYTLLKVKIMTGRTHQIRVHLAAYDHPIAGDDLYGTKKTREKNKRLNLGRIFLVADELAFVDLSGQRREFKIELPIELKKIFEKIK